jgi:hypothetical protein
MLYKCIQSITEMIQYNIFYFHVIFIVVSELLSFISLIALFFLGTERLLDSTYLNIRSDLPTRGVLLFDLIWLGLTAALFVILADTIPDRYIIEHAVSHISLDDTTHLQQSFLQCLTKRQEDFVVILLLIYVIIHKRIKDKRSVKRLYLLDSIKCCVFYYIFHHCTCVSYTALKHAP